VRANAVNATEDYLAAMDEYDEAYYGTSSDVENMTEEGEDDESESNDEPVKDFAEPRV
jgi:hypothetical protein